MDQAFLDRLSAQCDGLREQGLYKPERVLGSPQQPVVRLADGRELVNLCANNYLALANHPAVREAAHRAIPATAMAWLPCASSAARKACTRNSRPA